MAVKIEFETSNGMFDDGGGGAAEIDLILRKISEAYSNGSNAGAIRDLNGNRIGSWSATIDAEDEDTRDFREASE